MAEEKKAKKETKSLNINTEVFKTKSLEEHATWVASQYTAHPVVKNHHGIWKELIAWAEGDQFSLWSTKDRAVKSVPLNRRKKRIVINLMKPLVETIEGKLNIFHHVVGVPNSEEQGDIFGAEVATRLIEYNDYTADRGQILEDGKYDLTRTGQYCERWYIDPSVKSKAAILGKNREIVTTHDEEGEVVGELIPIFNVRPDPTARTPKKMRWIIEFKETTRDELLDLQGVTNEILDDIKDATGTGDKHSGMNVDAHDRDKDQETFVIAEYHEKPSSSYPKGRHTISAGNTVLYGDVNKNPDHELGYYFYFYHKTPYSFWAKGPLHFVQDIQREFNRMMSMISEHIESWRPKLAVGSGSLKRIQSLTVDPFEIVEIDYSRGEPKPISMPELSAQVGAFRDFLQSAIDLVSNIHEVSYSRLPQYASRAPASLYSMMLEQENIKFTPMLKRINTTLEDSATYRLKLMDKCYKHNRMVKILGNVRKSRLAYFSATDLNHNFDVRLEVGVSLAMSPTIQQNILLSLWDRGILAGEDKDLILKSTMLGTAEPELRAKMVDTERALRENQCFLENDWRGEEERDGVFVLKHDNHDTHLQYHTNLQKSEEAQEFNDETWTALDLHIETHLAFLMLEAQLGGGAGGAIAPGGVGTPPSPGGMGTTPYGMPGGGMGQEPSIFEAQ